MDEQGTPRKHIKIFQSQKEKIGELSDQDLQNIGELGSGTGGVVYKAKHLGTSLLMARKVIPLEVKPGIKNQITQDLQVLDECSYPHIVGFYGAFFHCDEVSICMEYMDAGSVDLLIKRSGRIPEQIIGKITLGVLKGLNYLNERHGIIHRAVKPSNILVNSIGEVKVTDFGISSQLIKSMTNSFVGTSSYMSPERLQGTHDSILSDIWSLGLSLMEMAYGIYPIPPPEPEIIRAILEPKSKKGKLPVTPKPVSIFELLDYIATKPPPKLEHPSFSPEFRNFVNICLKRRTNERADLITLMNHPWIIKAEEDKVDIGSFVCKAMDLSSSSSSSSLSSPSKFKFLKYSK